MTTLSGAAAIVGAGGNAVRVVGILSKIGQINGTAIILGESDQNVDPIRALVLVVGRWLSRRMADSSLL